MELRKNSARAGKDPEIDDNINDDGSATVNNDPPQGGTTPELGLGASKANVTPGTGLQAVVNVVTVFTAIAAFLLSILTWLDTHREPRLVATLPSMIRITPREGDNLIYVQPSFAVVDKAESSILVSRLRIQLARRGGEASPPPSFHWREVGEFYYTSDNPIPVYRLKGDAAPVVVSQSTPQSPLAVFESASWTLSAGQWDGTLVVMNQDGAALASLPFCVSITNEVATTLRQPEFQGKSLPFGSDPADVTRSAPGPCYT